MAKFFFVFLELELSKDNHEVLIKYCIKRNIKFLSSAFDVDGLDYLNSLNIKLFKVPSGEITNLPYLKKVASFQKPIILSSGMSNLEEINNAVSILVDNGMFKNDISILHCNSEYPTPIKDVNLKAMLTIRDSLNIQVGYSDHTMGIEVSVAAVALGARVIEKHFTLDRNLSGPDHKASLEPGELINMVSSIRNIELAISGDGIKQVSSSERKNIEIVRKSIYYKNNLVKGKVLDPSDLICLRPGDGVSPMDWDFFIGKKIKRDVSKHDKLSLNDFE